MLKNVCNSKVILHFRDAMFQLSVPKRRETNPKCVMRSDVRSNRCDPEIHINFGKPVNSVKVKSVSDLMTHSIQLNWRVWYWKVCCQSSQSLHCLLNVKTVLTHRLIIRRLALCPKSTILRYSNLKVQ